MGIVFVWQQKVSTDLFFYNMNRKSLMTSRNLRTVHLSIFLFPREQHKSEEDSPLSLFPRGTLIRRRYPFLFHSTSATFIRKGYTSLSLSPRERTLILMVALWAAWALLASSKSTNAASPMLGCFWGNSFTPSTLPNLSTKRTRHRSLWFLVQYFKKATTIGEWGIKAFAGIQLSQARIAFQTFPSVFA